MQRTDMTEIHNLVDEADTNQINVKFQMWQISQLSSKYYVLSTKKSYEVTKTAKLNKEGERVKFPGGSKDWADNWRAS